MEDYDDYTDDVYFPEEARRMTLIEARRIADKELRGIRSVKSTSQANTFKVSLHDGATVYIQSVDAHRARVASDLHEWIVDR